MAITASHRPLSAADSLARVKPRVVSKELFLVRDMDIDALSADGAQDTSRWADAVAGLAEAIRHLETAQHRAVLVGGSGEPLNPARRKAMLTASLD
jgi:hypothetical protein